MKNILVPTDFSKASKKAMKYAYLLAEKFNSQVELVNFYHPIPYQVEMYPHINPEEIELMKANLTLKLEKSANKYLEKRNVQSIFGVVEGLAYEGIIDKLEEGKHDLVVMGTQGLSSIERALFGSISFSVCEASNIPTLIVPEKTDISAIKKIVFATDFNNDDISAIISLSKIAKIFEAEIHVLHVIDGELSEKFEETAFESFMQNIIHKCDYKEIHFIPVYGDEIADEIEDYIEKVDASIISLTKESRTLFAKIMVPSITKKMIYHSEIPILVFPDNRED